MAPVKASAAATLVTLTGHLFARPELMLLNSINILPQKKIQLSADPNYFIDTII
jgi:hypothetical protein